MGLDSKNNIIDVCLFESFLAKYFLENPEIFDELFNKLFIAIDALIKANSHNRTFERGLFTVYTAIKALDSSITDLNAIKESRSLIIWDTFLKYFIERVMTMPELKYPVDSSISTLTELAHFGLFKNSPVLGSEVLLKKMRPKDLFSDDNRGVIALDEDTEQANFNIGILSEDAKSSIPSELANYLKFENYPSKQGYAPKEDSEMAKWLRAHHLPVISGVSGGVGKTVSGLSNLISFSLNDYKLLGLLIASSTVALGHHSFFEVQRPLGFITGVIKEQKNLLAFYEQVLPEEVKALDSYKTHMDGSYGASLINDLCFKLDCEQGEEAQPELLIGAFNK